MTYDCLLHTLIYFLDTLLLNTGVSVIHFSTVSDHQCKQLSPFVDSLCTRYPSIHFLKVKLHYSIVVPPFPKVRCFRFFSCSTKIDFLYC